jgi:hypothetical protein
MKLLQTSALQVASPSGCNGAGGSGSAEAPQPPYTLKRALKNGECRFPRGATSTGLDGPPWWVVSDAWDLVRKLTEHSSQLTLPGQHLAAARISVGNTLSSWRAKVMWGPSAKGPMLPW